MLIILYVCAPLTAPPAVPLTITLTVPLTAPPAVPLTITLTAPLTITLTAPLTAPLTITPAVPLAQLIPARPLNRHSRKKITGRKSILLYPVTSFYPQITRLIMSPAMMTSPSPRPATASKAPIPVHKSAPNR